MIAKTINEKSVEAVEERLSYEIDNGFIPTLAFVFISIQQDYKDIGSLLDEKGIAIFGVTSNGEFSNGSMEEGAIVIMLLDLNPAYYKIFCHELEEGREVETSLQLTAFAKEFTDNPAFITSKVLIILYQSQDDPTTQTPPTKASGQKSYSS